MNVTRQQIINGLVKYTKEEVIDKIIDKPLKMAIAAGISMLEINPSIASTFFDNDIISKILNVKDDGTYDIDIVVEILKKTMDEYEDFPVKIPAIKFISPTEKELSFSSRDVQRLKDYIIGGNV